MNNPGVFVQVNWLAVLLGGVFSMILGFLWYGPLFGKLWLRAIDKKEEELKSSPAIYVLAFLGALVTGYVLAVLVAVMFLVVKVVMSQFFAQFSMGDLPVLDCDD